MQADVAVTVHARDARTLGERIEFIQEYARMPDLPDVPNVPDRPDRPEVPDKPQVPTPYFDIGDATGKPGDVVTLSVEGGCLQHATGFHIGGGVGLDPEVERSGYGKFVAKGTKLGSFLRSYLKAQGLIVEEERDGQKVEVDQYWSIFQFFKYVAKAQSNPLPEEWWEYAVGFFSMEQERFADAVQIPNGTELFTLDVQILPETKPGEYVVTCKDEWYYATGRPRRRDFLYTSETDGPPGGWTKIETNGGTITVT